MPSRTDAGRSGAVVASTSSTTPTRKPPPPHSTTSRSALLRRLHSDRETVSTLQSSAVAAIGTLSAHSPPPIDSPTSLHRIAPKRAIKVVLIGDGGSGKTSLRHRFLSGTFFPSYRATIGADFITRSVPVDPLRPEGGKATVQIWDTAGQERFQSLGSAFYRGADAVIIAFDASAGEEALERVKGWYETFMEKAPGPGVGERGRFCWVCAGNKVDLDETVDRGKVWGVLDGLVPRVGDEDWGMDVEEAPADPVEVLARPDPNGLDDGQTSPTTTRSEVGNDSPTPARKGRGNDFSLSRKSLSSIAARAATQAETDSDTDDAHAANGGTVKTLYATPYNTLSNLAQLSTSPSAVSVKPPSDTSGGFLSSWRSRSKSKASSSNQGQGHRKRQSIRSIEVFQSDPESQSDSDSVGKGKRLAFPSSTSSGRGLGVGRQETPPRSVFNGRQDEGRRRMDSTLSSNSVYHTPRGSTFLSSSASGSINPSSSSASSSKVGRPGDASSSSFSLGKSGDHSTYLRPNTDASNRSSIASSTLTIKPTLPPPKSINDIFQPSSPSSPAPPHSPSTISIRLSPAPLPLSSGELEQGFTLFYTSAKTGHNVDRMFSHIVQRVVRLQAWEEAQLQENETEAEREERTRREEEVIRRTIRLASGKEGGRWFGCC